MEPRARGDYQLARNVAKGHAVPPCHSHAVGYGSDPSIQGRSGSGQLPYGFLGYSNQQRETVGGTIRT